MELYVHLPFCRSKCSYCDFPSFAGCEGSMAPYIDALLTEAEQYPEGTSIETVFFGGGTPSLLPAPLLKKLLHGLRARFDWAADAEVTAEANPGTLTEEWLAAAVEGGINRLSMGMQAAQSRLLKTLGRIHQWDDVRQSVASARAVGINNLNLDLMFGLPDQSMDDWHESLDAALSLQPRHISAYGLILEEGTPLFRLHEQGKLHLPDEETERAMYDLAQTVLSEHGLEPYELSNFALPGFACRHNIGYWRQIPYIGLGSSAASMLPSDRRDAAYLRTANPPSLADYLHMVQHAAWNRREVQPISRREAMFETMMLGLRMNQGVAESDFLATHRQSLDAVYGIKLRALERQGLLLHENGCWCLTRYGMDVQNAVLVELMD